MPRELPKSKKMLWDFAWIIPYITAVIYAVAYLFQLGYNSYFGIPPYLVSIDLPKVILAILSTLGLAILVVFSLNVFCTLFNLRADDYQDRSRSAMLALIFYSGLACIALLRTNLQGSTETWSTLITGFVFIVLIIAIGTKRFIDKFPASSTKATSRIDFIDYFKSYYRSHTYIVLVTILICLLGYNFGDLYPVLVRSYWSPKDNPDLFVVNTFGDKFVLVQLDSQKQGILTGQYKIIMPDQDGQEFILKQVFIDRKAKRNLK